MTAVDMLAGLSGNASPERTARLERALSNPRMDWSVLLNQAAAHGLVPLLYRHLVARPGLAVPDAARRELSLEFQRHAISRFTLARRLREILTLFAEAGIDALPYKGPVLAIQLYGHYAARQYGDLDILVRPEQLTAAMSLLRQHDLQEVYAIPAAWRGYYERIRHHYPWHDPETGILVELHWSLSDRFWGWRRGVDWFFEDTVVVDLLGTPVRAMGPERLLIAQCEHGVRGLWERLAWLADVAELIRAQPGLDWAAVFAEAEHRGFGRHLRISLLLVRREFGVFVPEPWAQRVLQDRRAAALAESLSAALHAGQQSPFGLLGRLWFAWRSGETLRARLYFVWAAATHVSENDLHRTRIPPHLGFVFGFLRPVRVVPKSLADWHRRRNAQP